MGKIVVNNSTPIGRDEIKEIFRSFQEEGKVEKELHDAMTNEMVELSLEGRVISDNARRLLKTLKACGEKVRLIEKEGKVVDSAEKKETMETLEELEARLFKRENFTFPKGWKKKLESKKYEEEKHYYVEDGNLYCNNEVRMFVLGDGDREKGKEIRRKESIDRYNWAMLKYRDTESLGLTYDCTDKAYIKAFKGSQLAEVWRKDPTLKLNLDNINYPKGFVCLFGDLTNRDLSYIPLWSPGDGEVFLIQSDAKKLTFSKGDDVLNKFPFSFVKNS